MGNGGRAGWRSFENACAQVPREGHRRGRLLLRRSPPIQRSSYPLEAFSERSAECLIESAALEERNVKVAALVKQHQRPVRVPIGVTSDLKSDTVTATRASCGQRKEVPIGRDPRPSAVARDVASQGDDAALDALVKRFSERICPVHRGLAEEGALLLNDLGGVALANDLEQQCRSPWRAASWVAAERTLRPLDASNIPPGDWSTGGSSERPSQYRVSWRRGTVAITPLEETAWRAAKRVQPARADSEPPPRIVGRFSREFVARMQDPRILGRRGARVRGLWGVQRASCR